MVTELIRPVNYNPGRSQKLIKLEITSCRFSQLECNEESGETEGYSAFYTPLLPLNRQMDCDISWSYSFLLVCWIHITAYSPWCPTINQLSRNKVIMFFPTIKRNKHQFDFDCITMELSVWGQQPSHWRLLVTTYEYFVKEIEFFQQTYQFQLGHQKYLREINI